MVADRKGVGRAERYWQCPCGSSRSSGRRGSIGQADAIEQIETVLSDAVRLRLRADVPVGAFLSGGIDSGLIAAMASRHLDRPITTLTVGFEDMSFDERPLARQVAERYGTDHHELIVRPEPARLLPAIAKAYDQPYADSSAIPSYCLAELARQHLKVVLNGDGGDEALAGYRRYVAGRWAGRLGVLAGPAGRPMWWLADGVLPETRGFRTRYAFVRRLVRGLALREPQRLLAWGNDGFNEQEKRRLVGDQGGWLATCTPTWRRVASLLDSAPDGASALDRQMWIDAQTLLPDDLLVKMDIATMAHGLEARSPLLDHVLFETAAALPDDVKLAGLTTKPILRELARRYLPDDVVTAPKRGFEVPLARWLQDDLRDLRDELLLDPTGLMAERFDRTALADLVGRRTGLDEARWTRRVWTLMMLAMWDRQQHP